MREQHFFVAIQICSEARRNLRKIEPEEILSAPERAEQLLAGEGGKNDLRHVPATGDWQR